MVEATRRGLAAPPGATQEPNRTGEESPTDKHRADALWAVVQCLCIGGSIDPDLVSSRAEVGRLHRQLCAGQEPKDLKILSGWRREAVGDLLLRMVRGEAKVELGWGERGLESRCLEGCE
jgi:hypothetical protein